MWKITMPQCRRLDGHSNINKKSDVGPEKKKKTKKKWNDVC